MMKKIVFAALALAFTLDSAAQEVDSLPKKQEIIPTFAKKLNIDLFFRGGGISDSYTDDSKNSTHFVIDNARLNLQGDFNEDLFIGCVFVRICHSTLLRKMVVRAL